MSPLAMIYCFMLTVLITTYADSACLICKNAYMFSSLRSKEVMFPIQDYNQVQMQTLDKRQKKINTADVWLKESLLFCLKYVEKNSSNPIKFFKPILDYGYMQ